MCKQRSNTLCRFKNTLVQFCGEHAGSVSCWFCLLDTGFALVWQFSSVFVVEEEFWKGHAARLNFQLDKDKVRGNTLVRYVLRLWNCTQFNKDNSNENTHLLQRRAIYFKNKCDGFIWFPNAKKILKIQMYGASWLAKNYNGSNSSVVAIG